MEEAKVGKKKSGVRDDATRIHFVEWLARPEFERDPRNQTEFAAQFHVDVATLSKWKAEPGFMDRVVERANQLVRDAHPEVLRAHLRKIKEGDTQAIKLYYEYVQHWAPRTEVKAEVKTIETISDEELAELKKQANEP